mmetsp:Transcript_20146/g.43448  ORF Transcript_20146/g.43448 Transcript_20146/m.43448 type:complete len:121 (+) Transcript_20146:242-604(+)|eukprot:CAMPEP_0168736220 /NCGR_PEP_ID=MMETSP0724-20121128/9749_1 /TAXON_ID=265536 /ORGANISM="Amphiprora sp., Strain CCMP467" /LENGTH=120 /DNA_ID=CAMNT_0008783413 /DNA_START=232 /DNA_END=594 /DNA_ORIENTATION=-
MADASQPSSSPSSSSPSSTASNKRKQTSEGDNRPQEHLHRSNHTVTGQREDQQHPFRSAVLHAKLKEDYDDVEYVGCNSASLSRLALPNDGEDDDEALLPLTAILRPRPTFRTMNDDKSF